MRDLARELAHKISGVDPHTRIVYCGSYEVFDGPDWVLYPSTEGQLPEQWMLQEKNCPEFGTVALGNDEQFIRWALGWLRQNNYAYRKL